MASVKRLACEAAPVARTSSGLSELRTSTSGLHWVKRPLTLDLSLGISLAHDTHLLVFACVEAQAAALGGHSITRILVSICLCATGEAEDFPITVDGPPSAQGIIRIKSTV